MIGFFKTFDHNLGYIIKYNSLKFIQYDHVY